MKRFLDSFQPCRRKNQVEPRDFIKSRPDRLIFLGYKDEIFVYPSLRT